MISNRKQFPETRNCCAVLQSSKTQTGGCSCADEVNLIRDRAKQTSASLQECMKSQKGARSNAVHSRNKHHST